jgi:putative FmdB family regulatory protein
MPIYEYKCQVCGQKVEIIQRAADPPKRECPKCGGLLKKMLSAPAIQFKGHGWYVTDYAHKGSDGGSGSRKKSSDASAPEKTGKKGPAPTPANKD